MYKISVTYKNFNDEECTDDLYFNITKAEMMEMELLDGENNSLLETLEKIIETKDQKKIYKYFKATILKAYGKKSEDGKRFIKNQELCDEFVQTLAYEEFFMKIIADTNVAAEFIKGILPADLDLDVSQITTLGATSLTS